MPIKISTITAHGSTPGQEVKVGNPHPSRTACQNGGWGRARQKADQRRLKPSPAEGRVIKILQEMNLDFDTEVEIFTIYPQWIDIVTWINGVMVAIEVDGSHSWHKSPASKMKGYDEQKTNWCKDHGIPLRVISITQRTKEAKEHVKNAIQSIEGEKSGRANCSHRIQNHRIICTQVC